MATVTNTKIYRDTSDNKWYLRWRHLAAYVFLLTVLFDFIVMPIVYEANNKIDVPSAVSFALKFPEPASKTAVVQMLLNKRTWEPITLQGGGIFFICFGAILGAASWTRGAEKLANAKNNLLSDSTTNSDEMLASSKPTKPTSK